MKYTKMIIPAWVLLLYILQSSMEPFGADRRKAHDGRRLEAVRSAKP